jgi:hypothetical protein
MVFGLTQEHAWGRYGSVCTSCFSQADTYRAVEQQESRPINDAKTLFSNSEPCLPTRIIVVDALWTRMVTALPSPKSHNKKILRDSI